MKLKVEAASNVISKLTDSKEMDKSNLSSVSGISGFKQDSRYLTLDNRPERRGMSLTFYL